LHFIFTRILDYVTFCGTLRQRTGGYAGRHASCCGTWLEARFYLQRMKMIWKVLSGCCNSF